MSIRGTGGNACDCDVGACCLVSVSGLTRRQRTLHIRSWAKLRNAFAAAHRPCHPWFLVLQGQRGGGIRLSRTPFHREGPHPDPSCCQIQGGSASYVLTLQAQSAHPGSQDRWLRAALNCAEDTGHAVRVWRDSEAVDAVHSDACFCGVWIGRAS